MKRVFTDHEPEFALFAYLATAVALALLPLVIHVRYTLLPWMFADAAAVLGLAGLCLWLATRRALTALAFRDELTRLGNRAAFNARAATITPDPRGGNVGLVIFDVDGLKEVNEGCGHQAGDELLALVGGQLAGVAGAPFRIGGDEFVVVIDRRQGESAVPVLRRLEPFACDFASCGHNHNIRLSYGFASALPNEAFFALFQRADQRLREFKRELYAQGALPDRREMERLAEEEEESPPPPQTEQPNRRSRLRLLG